MPRNEASGRPGCCMNESFFVGLVVGGLIAIAGGLRMASGDRRMRELSRIEAKLDALLEHEKIPFDPYSRVPSSVIDALRRGQKIEAIKAYREATGAGLKEAKEYIDDVQNRASSRV